MKYLTIKDVNLKNKRVLLRVDLNSPINDKTKKIELSDRLIQHSKTIKYLLSKKASVVILAHQGRKGDKDFRNLKQHYLLLKRFIKKINYVDDIIGKKAISEIKKLKPGNALLLENTRYLDEETKNLSANQHSKGKLVSTLYHYFDYFVLDAFSILHRSNASIVGFTVKLKTLVGLTLDKELTNSEKLFSKIKKPFVMILGGAKPDDVILLLNNKKADYILTSGILGELFLIAKGYKLGKKEQELKEKGYLNNIKEIKKYLNDKRIFIPEDFAIALNKKRKEISVIDLPINYLIYDIGKNTIEDFKEIIKNAKTIYYKGPQGYYENKLFNLGTKEILQAIKKSKAYSIAGGGHSLDAISKFINKKSISYISLAGGALVEYLAGKKLPGLEALKIKR